MSRRGIIFGRIERFKKVKFPAFLKHILIESAFDSAAALKTIKKPTIGDIEQFVSKRLILLKKTVYIDETGNLKKNPFKFLPGHEALILNLPNDVDDYLREKNKEKGIPAIGDLKLSLVERINIFANQNKLKIATDRIIITHSNKQVKCFLKCPYCGVQLSLPFDSSWKLSNYKKHILCCVKKIVQPPNLRIERASKRAEPGAVLRTLQNVVPLVIL